MAKQTTPRRRVAVMIPTYNESENLPRLLDEILATGVVDLCVVVDDNSPDGTGALADAYAQSHKGKVAVVHRFKRRGRGTAGIEGMLHAVKWGATYVIEMDADFSHHPRYLPDLVRAMETPGCDIAIGSRFVAGGADLDRGLYRKTVTRLAGWYVRYMLGVKIRDVSSGFRCFRREVLEAIDLENLLSVGPSIVLEILYKSVLRGFRCQEVPIVFRDRRQGTTKLDYITLLETMVMVLRLRKMGKTGSFWPMGGAAQPKRG